MGRDLLAKELDEIDRACSRFRADSELSRLNATAGRPIAVSALLMQAIDTAVWAAEVTDGDVDPTCGQALIDLGYDRDFSEIDHHGTPIRVVPRPVPGWQRLAIDRAARTVCVPAGVVVDLGATAKALAADRAAIHLAAALGCGVLVNLGGDIAIAGELPESGWWVEVSDVAKPEALGTRQLVMLESGGLATSGTTARRWGSGGDPIHHIISPATGLPAQTCWRAVSVAAASCVDANIASTCAVIRGRSALRWLTELALPARLVSIDGGVVTVSGWPTDPVRGD